MQKLKTLLHSTYTYFSFSPRRHFEDCKFVELLEMKRNKLLYNVKIRLIFMLFLVKRVIEEYMPLVVRMNDDFHAIPTRKTTKLNPCVTLRLSWASFAFYPYWKQSMNSSSLLKMMMFLFMTLWELCKCVVQNLYSFLLWSKKSYIDLKFKSFFDLVDAQMMGC
jgi:hypothetical protein